MSPTLLSLSLSSALSSSAHNHSKAYERKTNYYAILHAEQESLETVESLQFFFLPLITHKIELFSACNVIKTHPICK